MIQYDCWGKHNYGMFNLKFLSDIPLSEQQVIEYLLNNSGLGVDTITELKYTELDLGKWRKE